MWRTKVGEKGVALKVGEKAASLTHLSTPVAILCALAGSLDCVGKVVGKDGLRGLYAGTLPSLAANIGRDTTKKLSIGRKRHTEVGIYKRNVLKTKKK